MENAMDRHSIPNTYFRLKSWCNRWLSVDPNNLRKVTFVEQEKASYRVCLIPRDKGRYMLQLLVESVCGEDRTKLESFISNKQLQDGSDHAWFLRRQGQLVLASQTEIGSSEKEFQFTLEFDETGYVRFCNGLDNAYWSSDCRGHLVATAKKPKKSETFQLIEFSAEKYAKLPAWISHAPVRVNLKSHTGKYLCSAKSIIWAAAQAPCCCEEFLLDVRFLPFAPFWESFIDSGECSEFSCSERQSTMNIVESKKLTWSEKGNGFAARSKCSIRTSDGMHYLTAETDGKLCQVRHDEGQGHETFALGLLNQKGQPKVCIWHCNHANVASYVSTEPSGKVISNKPHRRKWEEYILELANGSQILIQSVHGGYVGTESASDCKATPFLSTQLGAPRRVCCHPSRFQEVTTVDVWRVRAHGDSLYTLVAATSPRECGDVYLFVDAKGRVLQSSEPGVHFPATASLFEIRPVTAACFTGRSRDTVGTAGMGGSVVGFTIRTNRKVHGKQRFLTAEPNGVLKAYRVCASRWETFRLVDVDATAATASPSEYECLPAAVNLNGTAVLSTPSSAARRGLAESLFADEQGLIISRSGRKDFGALRYQNNLDYLKKASLVTTAAVWEGQAVPARIPASLQHLCIYQICLQASTEVASDDLGKASSTILKDLFLENSMGIPDDLLTRIRTHWRSRQLAENSCKSLPSMFIPQNGPLSQNGRNGPALTGTTQQSLWEGNVEGLHCHSCNQDGVLQMDPAVNPAHHRYLEVQYHVQSEMAQATGFLWNLISFAGVSIMSTVLLFQFFANGKKRQNSRTRR